jgi:bifunctional enzyme CysN/CysC
MSQEPLKLRQTVKLRCATQEAACTIQKLERRIDTATLRVIDEEADQLQINEMATATFMINSPLVLERFDQIEELGRFVLEQDFDLLGAGIFTSDRTN